MDVKTIYSKAEADMKKAVEHCMIEFGKIRTGRASTSLLDSVRVDYYGQQTPISGVATISTPDASSIIVQPWERNMLGPIEKAILAANLGLTPTNDGTIIRIAIPALNEERRRELVKIAKRLAEESKVGVRTARHDAIKHLKQAEKEEHLSEDLRKDGEEMIQKLTDRYVAEVDKHLADKEKDVMTV